jgi:iron complex transport system permease protein
MKIVIDLDHLLAQGRITKDEHVRFSAFAAQETGSLAFNILIGFSLLAICGATLALVPQPQIAMLLGLGLLGLGLGVFHAPKWAALQQISLTGGALLFGAGLYMTMKGQPYAFAVMAATFTLGAIVARSQMLMVFGVLALSAFLGARSGYWHATYAVNIQQPVLTIGVFSALAWLSYQISLRVPHLYERIALASARASVFLVNMGFWIGSLWGDRIAFGEPATFINRDVFSVLWAAALIATALWAWRINRRWLVNVCAVFGGIHFYTQWFERLGANPGSMLLAGLTALGLILALKYWNQKQES